MPNSAKTNKIILKGYRIFADAINYSDEEVINYTTLFLKVFSKFPNYAKTIGALEDKNMLISGCIKAIKTLPKDYQLILELRYFKSKNSTYTYNQIANTLGMTKNSLVYHHNKCMEKIIRRHSMFIISEIQRQKQIAVSGGIETLDISIRTFNCLRRHGIYTISDFMATPDEEFKRIRNLGLTNYEEIIQAKKKLMNKSS